MFFFNYSCAHGGRSAAALQADHDVVRAAETQSSFALRCASAALQADRAIRSRQRFKIR
jgi:hypothetical protein